jgi:hypothetical protein
MPIETWNRCLIFYEVPIKKIESDVLIGGQEQKKVRLKCTFVTTG